MFHGGGFIGWLQEGGRIVTFDSARAAGRYLEARCRAPEIPRAEREHLPR